MFKTYHIKYFLQFYCFSLLKKWLNYCLYSLTKYFFLIILFTLFITQSRQNNDDSHNIFTYYCRTKIPIYNSYPQIQYQNFNKSPNLHITRNFCSIKFSPIFCELQRTRRQTSIQIKEPLARWLNGLELYIQLFRGVYCLWR